ncbi:radical SAM protein [bacterium]|nr:radical SAM protein [bacterium]
MIKFLLFLKKLRSNLIKLSLDKAEYKSSYNNLTMHLNVNSNCNAKCKFCELRKQPTKELSDVILYEYLLPLYPKTDVVVPTYGEYTISSKVYNYLTWLMEKFPHINLLTETNGINFNEKWQEFSADNLVRTSCSLNAINAKRYQETVWEGEGGEAAYTKTINNLRNYQKLLKEKGLEDFGTRLSMVLTPDNYCDIPEFVRLALELNSCFVTLFFDVYNLDIINTPKRPLVERALDTLLELDTLLRGHFFLFYKLYTPFDSKFISERKKQLKLSKEELKEKYKDIWELAQYRNIKEEYKRRTEIRNKQGKAPISFLRELTITGSQYILNGKDVDFCTLPWDHLLLTTEGYVNICSWYCNTKVRRPHISEFVKDGKLDSDALFNSVFYKYQRHNMKTKKYVGCMKNCPYKNAEFKKYYTSLINS